MANHLIRGGFSPFIGPSGLGDVDPYANQGTDYQPGDPITLTTTLSPNGVSPSNPIASLISGISPLALVGGLFFIGLFLIPPRR